MTVLAVEHLTVAKPLALDPVVDDLSFTVGAGEVVALAGAMGAGRTAALSALFGIARATVTGTVRVDGSVVELRGPRHALDAGFAFMPEDRKALGRVLGLSVQDSLALSALGRMSRFGAVNGSAISRLRDLSIKVPGLGAEVATLSGGNQQKLLIAKRFDSAPRVLLLDEPTRGLEASAHAAIHALIEELTIRGHAVVLASSDLSEVVRLADRVYVLRDGKLAGTLTNGEITSLAIMQLAVGTLGAALAQEAMRESA